MAGIGFRLNQLFEKKGVFAKTRAYGYTALVTIGPMILGVLILLGISFAARLGGLDDHSRELTNSMITYSLLYALMQTSGFNMILTRYTSDMLYLDRYDEVIGSFYGGSSIMVIMTVLIYGVFLHFSGIALIYRLLSLWLALIMVIVWTEVIYLTAMKNYRVIVYAFLISFLSGFLLALIFVALGKVSVVTMMLSVILTFGMIMVWYYCSIDSYFPDNSGSSFAFMRWFDRYPQLALTGFLLHLSLFSHIVLPNSKQFC